MATQALESGKLTAEDCFNVFQAIGQCLCLFLEAKFVCQDDGFSERILSLAVMSCWMGVGTRIVKLVVGILTPPDALIETTQPIFALFFGHHRTLSSICAGISILLTSHWRIYPPNDRLAIFFAFAPMAKTCDSNYQS